MITRYFCSWKSLEFKRKSTCYDVMQFTSRNKLPCKSNVVELKKQTVSRNSTIYPCNSYIKWRTPRACEPEWPLPPVRMLDGLTGLPCRCNITIHQHINISLWRRRIAWSYEPKWPLLPVRRWMDTGLPCPTAATTVQVVHCLQSCYPCSPQCS